MVERHYHHTRPLAWDWGNKLQPHQGSTAASGYCYPLYPGNEVVPVALHWQVRATRLVICTDHLWTYFAASAERTVQWGAKKRIWGMQWQWPSAKKGYSGAHLLGKSLWLCNFSGHFHILKLVLPSQWTIIHWQHYAVSIKTCSPSITGKTVLPSQQSDGISTNTRTIVSTKLMMTSAQGLLGVDRWC